MSEDLKRRDILKFSAGTVIAARTAVAQGHKFLTADEFAMLDELTEILIPADDLSQGARAAKVAEYIDASLGEAFEEEKRTKFREGLRLVDKLSLKMNKVPLMKATPAQRQAVLLRMATNERKPVTPEEIFFGELKSATAGAFYTTKIGIHDALDYKGNVYQGGDYAGVLPSGPALAKVSETK